MSKVMGKSNRREVPEVSHPVWLQAVIGAVGFLLVFILFFGLTLVAEVAAAVNF